MVKIPRYEKVNAHVLRELTFKLLANQWYEESRFFSFAKQRQTATYREILALGDAIVPLVIQELQAGKHLWFHALKTLTKQNPVAELHQGNPEKMAEDWIRWAEVNKLI